MAGLPMMNGARVLEGYVPIIDATIVTRLLDAGATIVGKTACADFSGGGHTSGYGPVRNPRKPTHAPGGSSKGSAAALAAGDVAMAIGGDQGGSIRIPASWFGVVGHKTTYGLIPYQPVDEVFPGRSRHGLILWCPGLKGGSLMAMGQQKDRQGDLMVSWSEMPRSPGHVFYDRLQLVLIEGGFDGFAEAVCQPYYAARMGAPSVPPGRYFRMHLVGYFEGIDSERGLEWRCSDSLSLREFLLLEMRERVPDHSWLSRTRARLPHEVHTAVFDWVLALIAEAGLCQWRSKKGPPRRCKKGPLGGCGLVPVVHGRAPRATRCALNRLTRRRAREGPVGPRGQAWAGWSVQLAVGV